MEEIEIYYIIKILHIVAVISWMAGLLYLPRIYVYHCRVAFGSDTDKIFQEMERKLLRYIMNPAMILSFFLGFYLAIQIGFAGMYWLHLKIVLVLFMAAFHGYLSICQKNLHKEKIIIMISFFV